MSAIAALIADMIRAGVDPDLIGRAAEAMAAREVVMVETKADERSSAAIRQERYRLNKKTKKEVGSITRDVTDITNVTRDVTPPSLEVSSGSSSPTPPITPNLPKPSPLSPPKGGSCPPKKSKNSRIDYPGPFQILWDTFPHHPNSSKAEAHKSWSLLDESDRQACLDGAMGYRRWLKSEIQRRPRDPPSPCHLVTYVNQRRWEAMLEAAQ